MYLILEDVRFEPYISFIESCKNKTPKHGHKHHIVPKHLDGDDSPENLIYLSYKDHHTAHVLLAECFPEKSKYRDLNYKSANMIRFWLENEDVISGWTGTPSTSLNKFTEKYGVELGLEKYNECYSKGRNDLQSFINRYGLEEGTQKHKEYRERISIAIKSHKRTEQHNKNISKSKKGKKTGPCSKERKANISKSLKGRKMSTKHKEKTRRATPCIIDGIFFKNLVEAGKCLGVSKTTILNRIRDERFPNYKFSKKEQ